MTVDSRSRSSSFQVRSVVGLINLVNWEVGCVNVRGELGLEGRADAAKSVKLDATEELVVLDLISTTSAKAVLRIANEATTQD